MEVVAALAEVAAVDAYLDCGIGGGPDGELGEAPVVCRCCSEFGVDLDQFPLFHVR